jgi:site-specific recombinase XerD
MKPTDFAYHLTNYLSGYLPGQRNVSANTIKSYRDTFMIFLRYCRDEKHLPSERFQLKDFTRPLAEDFLSWVEKERGCSISTRNQRLAALHAFCKYLQYECPESLLSYQSVLALPQKKHPAKSFGHLSLQGVRVILSQPDQTNKNGFRDLTLLSLLYDTGARVQEIADITLSDVRLEPPATIMLKGKGGKARIVPLMERTAALLRKYIDSFFPNPKAASSYPLFFNRTREKLTRSGIAYILDKYVDMARGNAANALPDKVTPHVLRHSKAMHLLQSGVNLVYIRDLLGHAALKTTEIYARADSNAKRAALESAAGQKTTSVEPVWHRNTDLLAWLQDLGR